MITLALTIALAQAAAPVAPTPAIPKPVRICREGQQQLGTHMRTGRVCKTAEEWDEDKKPDSYIPSMTVIRRQDVPFEGNKPLPCCQ